jgi:UDP-N-acetylmuramoyl-tripeptide--D-alanyl-D-alanine ligase
MSRTTRSAWTTLGQLVERAEGRLAARDPGGLDTPIGGVSIDTRTLEPGDLFVPLPGTNVDGHEYIAEAFRRGAAASLCAAARLATFGPKEPGPLVVVDDVTVALGRVAHRHRRDWPGLVVGITGSSGKTTTKDLVGRVFAADRPTLTTRGNLNNQWGVPLTLLELRSEHRAAIVEMGTNHPGEIGSLAAIAAPDAAIITNVGHAHLEHFGTVEAIAREKTALARAVPAGGVVFAHADSPGLMAALAGLTARIVTFGNGAKADVHPAVFEDRGAAGSRLRVEGFPALELALVGRHQALNALAALAVAREFELEPDRSVAAIASYRPTTGRMEVRHARGATLLVDCYNANPESTRAALQTLATWPDARRRIAILGDMLELGPKAPELHREAGATVRGAELWAVGRMAGEYVAGATSAEIEALRFDEVSAVAAALREALAPGTVVLLKASRGAQLERVLEGLESEG